MTQLDLSSNMLHDEDLKILLKEIKAPRELILSNNRLTVESISTLLEMKHQTLKILKLSYNPLGSKILLELPSLFHTLKKLEVLEMEGTGLGHRLDLHNMEYDTLLTQDDQVKRKVRINIRNNHFQGNMLSEWTCKWKALPGIEALQMSGVTSDEGWEGFHQLTNFKGLKSLDFSRTVKGVLNIQDLSNFFMLDSNLHHLDLSYCNLVEHDIDMLCEGLEYNMALKSLNLKSNPKLGDRAIQKIESTDLRQLTLLNIADCGMTNQSMDVILQWIRHCKFNEIDVSENESLIQNRAQLKYLIQHYPQGRIFVFKMSLDEDISLNGLDLPTGFQIQKSLITQANPFF
ncbi:RNI-like protein [Backusella circina FSU 941]|nr:RNI-like protein [Backusella circina FSU 941]